jgi:hypothetical protein
MEAVPQFGGHTTQTSTATRNWGINEVPTPSEIVAALDKHVIGQQHAKRVRLEPNVSLCGQHAKSGVHAAMGQPHARRGAHVPCVNSVLVHVLP